jgi:drug/metabolite transporter (DMT)-like permease
MNLQGVKSGYVYAALAAVLFGASTPAAKILLGATPPELLAGLLYLGSGCGLLLLWMLRRRSGRRSESPLKRRDLPWLSGSIVLGGIAAPLLLLHGLQRTDASSASLLLNVESVATGVIAWSFFKEHAHRNAVLGMCAIVAGAVVLSWNGGVDLRSWIGPLLIVLACIGWGLDNNFTARISANDPVQIAMVKGLTAGSVNTILAVSVQHQYLLSAQLTLAAAIVGFLGYGSSIVLYIVSLRHVGAARTGAIFATAPFVGAAIALMLGNGSLDVRLAAAAVCMGVGVVLHLTEQHAHEHTHEYLEHEHPHRHDEHHQHAHEPGQDMREPHCHPHVHEVMTHAHPHLPDIHHRHSHGAA